MKIYTIKKFTLGIVTILLVYGCGGTKTLVTADNSPVLAFIDLVNIVDDKVEVIINPGAFIADAVSFYIPKTVPGTYSEDNYGKYIENFKAFDYNGKELTVSKKDDNTWSISNGKSLDKVTYLVNDTYDTEREVEEAVFSPAGTNIAKGENYMLNLHGFVGYFNDLKEVPYEITITKPSKLKATTSLIQKGGDKQDVSLDTFVASRYFEVIDNPIMYSKHAAVSFQVNDITVNLSVYSPNNTYTAASLKERMEKMMNAQKAFLGDINSTKEYNILLYLSTLEETDASGFGALEHHTSTVVVLPEAMPIERLEQTMVDVVSHEFFHIVTPLNVHSKEIQYFDFNDPKMSEHLWMYEGTTEYFANIFQIQQGLIDEEEFYARIMDKVSNAKSFDDEMSFTSMSKYILKEPFKANYANVYEKGTLINMSLDILLKKLSGGKNGILWLMKELSIKYGKNSPFEDAELIDEIVAMTYPEVRDFFDTHVIGDTPIDYSEYFSMVGLATTTIQQQSGYFLNGEVPFIDVDEENDNAIFVRNGIELNSFFTDLGMQGGDVIKEINGTAINLEAIRPVIGQSFGWTPDTEISIKIKRGEEVLDLKGKVGAPLLNVKTIAPIDDANEEQLALRNAWLKE
ncbi:MAG: peptidase M61 [Flavobacteriaceae bacterium]|nr:MAG: peptidase M61 [Flavobacteriaceae bacterium]